MAMTRRSSRLAGVMAQQTPAPGIAKPGSKTSSRSNISRGSSSAASNKTSGSATTATTPRSVTTDIPTLPFADGQAFRRYMVEVGVSAPGVWLKIAKKSTMIPTVTYDEAIDEALCCGWIDGQRRPLDAQYFLQRFTPRRRRSTWSQRNVGKVAALAAAGRMLPAGLAEVDAAKADGRWERAYAGSSTIEVPADFRVLLDARPRAAELFDSLSKSARYPFLHRLQTVKKEDTRTRKMAEFVDLLDRGDTL
ncbi:hypothetical protein V2A60_006977 [Cordyceps javanica]|uniref:Bacteriocin-protection, ydeI or ompD-Associated domain-containing protein n=1 Tax=Cordyceps javanica TaxID=43265 RepID=A0A545US36_9HYPO|nr:bacteriocin-protection, ydeI or ompD-Associated domain-containing protein [Cordyceps javanica]TQW04468.1 bacteriocin-protection, ydeI or ompD-Associated domain-containing protein [Cordyceps javanica]